MRYLGRKAELPNVLRGDRRSCAPEQRGPTGKAANQARQALEALIAERAEQLAGGELEERLRADVVDVTLPGAPPQPVGRLHLLTATRREIEDVFLGLGFRIAEGPEVETVYYNFDALNHAPTHPARERMDTFYVAADDVVLRTHTSPMQIRAMEAQPPPLYVIVPGRVYRRDSDATHTPQFHQIEGLAVDVDITLADLKGTLLAFARAIFGPDREVRLRPHFFPFTEPSVEVDVSCFMDAPCARHALPRLQGHRLGRDPRLGDGRPERLRLRRRVRLRPRARAGLRLRHGHRADRDAQARRARPAAALRQRRALPGAVRMRVPSNGSTSTARRTCRSTSSPTRLAMTGTEVDRVEHHGVARARALRRRPRAVGRSSTPTPTG